MKDLFLVFSVFFKKCTRRNIILFYCGALSSCFAGFSEAYLFKIVSDLFEVKSISSGSINLVLSLLGFRFLWVFINAYVISLGSASVTGDLMRHFIVKASLRNYKGNIKNKIPQVINESERIGMGYYLAWQNILSNLIQFGALLFAAAVLISGEFTQVIIVLLPIYLVFSSVSTKLVARYGLIRMNALRTMSARLTDNANVADEKITPLIATIGSGILNVRIWSLIQKPSLELMGLLSLAVSICVDVYIFQSDAAKIFANYALLATIFIRLLPYVNQVQNGLTLAASVHHEVKSYNEEKI